MVRKASARRGAERGPNVLCLQHTPQRDKLLWKHMLGGEGSTQTLSKAGSACEHCEADLFITEISPPEPSQ